jgi:F-type H+-transporting ATPase subunit gamma
MRHPQDIALEENAMRTIGTLTSAFESMSSMRISQIKTQVLTSQLFFTELWHLYDQLRVDQLFRFGREGDDETIIDKELYIAITAEGGFSGDIDQKLINWMLESYDPAKQDIMIIGHHGAIQLTQANVSFQKYFKLPSKDQNINVAPLIREARKYRTTTVWYQTYVSLMVQDIKKIELNKAVQAAGSQVKKDGKDSEIISEASYIFEPSSFSVIAHLERSMLQISLGQTILESKLAQYASRFRAMSAAKQLAVSTSGNLHTEFNRVKRSIADARLKEIINGMKRVRQE